MSKQQPNSLEDNVGVGIICLFLAMVLFFVRFSVGVSNVLIGWFLLGISVAAIVAAIGAKTRFPAQSSNIGVIGAILLWAFGVAGAIWGKGIPSLVVGFGSFFVLIVGFAIVYVLITHFEHGKRTWIFISSALCILACGLFVYFRLFASTISVWNIIILFLAASTLRQGLHNLLLTLVPERSQDWLLYLLPEILTVVALVFLSWFDHVEPYFHVTVGVLAIALFTISSERTIPELAASERAKIGDNNGVASPQRFYSVITKTYSGINFPVLGLLILLSTLDLPRRLIDINVSSAVFQASLGSVAIITAFTVLILQQPQQSDSVASRQRYILRGLTGIAFMFISISIVAFVALAMTPQVQSEIVLANLKRDLLEQILANQAMLFGLILQALYEWFFLAVPVSLLFIYGLVRDFVSDYRDTSIRP